MKKFIAIIALALSTMAAAESTLIFETDNSWDYDVYPEFQINKQLGRAWVNVVLTKSWGDSTDSYDNRVKVEGLAYNAETKEIVLEKDGQQIVCGNLYNRRWVLDFGGTIRMTNRCKFTVKKFKKVIDNGFETHRVPVIHVFFDAQ